MVVAEEDIIVIIVTNVDNNTIHVHASNKSGHHTSNGDGGNNNHGYKESSTISLHFLCANSFKLLTYWHRCRDSKFVLECSWWNLVHGHWCNFTLDWISRYSFVLYCSLSFNKNVVDGGGFEILVRGYGQTYLSLPYPPLSLNNVLHSPKIIINLIYVRRITIDNNVTIEFNHFDFSMTDIQIGMPLMRCDSTWDLYPITTTSRPQSISPSTFIAFSLILWHNHLGHPTI